MRALRTIITAVVMGGVLIPAPARAIPLVPDTFEDATTQGWLANLLGMGAPPVPPTNVPDGGPLGAGDGYLQLTATGGSGTGSKLSALNLSQWADDYIAADVTAISMSVINLGATDLFLRLAFEDPIPGPPANVAFSSDPIVVPVGSGWIDIAFPVNLASLTAGIGSVDLALRNTTLIRLYHSEADNFPNPVFPIASVVGQLGVDNIAAVTAIPEPVTLWCVATGLGAIAAKRRRRNQRH